jgi:hypothetical protein
LIEEAAVISKKTTEAIGAIYDQIHLAFWATLISFLAYFAIVVVPNIPAARSKFEIQRIQKIAAEHEYYCKKWGMGGHAKGHDQCILDLQAFRAQVETRIYDDNAGM